MASDADVVLLLFSQGGARDHIDFVERFRERVLAWLRERVFAWLRENHVELLGG